MFRLHPNRHLLRPLRFRCLSSTFHFLKRVSEEELFEHIQNAASSSSIESLRRKPGSLHKILDTSKDVWGLSFLLAKDHQFELSEAELTSQALEDLNKEISEGTTKLKPSDVNTFSKVIEYLNELGIFKSKLQVRVPNSSHLSDSLGLEHQDIKLVGRDSQLKDGIEYCNTSFTYESSPPTASRTVASSRKPLFVYSGMSGSGKTRTAFEVASHFESSKTITLALTFNSNSTLTQYDIDFLVRKVTNVPPTVCLTLRILYYYVLSSKTPLTFTAFSELILEELKLRSIPLSILNLNNVLDHYQETFPEHDILLILDETMKPLTDSKGKVSANHLENLVTHMLHSCDPKKRAMFLTAFATDFLTESFRTSGRFLRVVTLPFLNEEDSLSLLRHYLNTRKVHFKPLLASTRLSESDAMNSLVALGIFSLPRLIIYFHSSLVSKPTTFPELFRLMKVFVLQRYGPLVTSWPLVSAAIQGEQFSNLDQCLPNSSETIRSVVRTGWMPPPLGFDREAITIDPFKISLPPFLLMCYQTPSSEPPPPFDGLFSDLASLMSFRPSNLWEEFVIRLLILRSHLSMYSNCTSPLELFGSPSQISSSPNFLKNVKVDLSQGFDRVILTFDTPPSPEFLEKHSQLARHVWMPYSLQESGIDALIFLKTTTEGSTLDEAHKIPQFICLGIQCKYSDEKATTTLSNGDMEHSHEHFLSKMNSAGWKPEWCGLVFVALRKCPQELILPSSGGGSAILTKERVENWLGPSMLEYVRGLHHQVISNLPRISISEHPTFKLLSQSETTSEDEVKKN